MVPGRPDQACQGKNDTTYFGPSSAPEKISFVTLTPDLVLNLRIWFILVALCHFHHFLQQILSLSLSLPQLFFLFPFLFVYERVVEHGTLSVAESSIQLVS